MHGWRGGAPCCADKLSATLWYSSLVFPFLFLPPLPPVDEPLRFVPLPAAFFTRVRSTVDMPLVSPRMKVTCRSGLLNLCIYCLLRGQYRSLGES